MVYPTACCVTNWLVHVVVILCVCACVCVCVCVCVHVRKHAYICVLSSFGFFTNLPFCIMFCRLEFSPLVMFALNGDFHTHQKGLLQSFVLWLSRFCAYVGVWCFFDWVGEAFGPFCIKQNVTFYLCEETPYRGPPWGETTPLLKPLFFSFFLKPLPSCFHGNEFMNKYHPSLRPLLYLGWSQEGFCSVSPGSVWTGLVCRLHMILNCAFGSNKHAAIRQTPHVTGD